MSQDDFTMAITAFAAFAGWAAWWRAQQWRGVRRRRRRREEKKREDRIDSDAPPRFEDYES